MNMCDDIKTTFGIVLKYPIGQNFRQISSLRHVLFICLQYAFFSICKYIFIYTHFSDASTSNHWGSNRIWTHDLSFPRRLIY